MDIIVSKNRYTEKPKDAILHCNILLTTIISVMWMSNSLQS